MDAHHTEAVIAAFTKLHNEGYVSEAPAKYPELPNGRRALTGRVRI